MSAPHHLHPKRRCERPAKPPTRVDLRAQRPRPGRCAGRLLDPGRGEAAWRRLAPRKLVGLSVAPRGDLRRRSQGRAGVATLGPMLRRLASALVTLATACAHASSGAAAGLELPVVAEVRIAGNEALEADDIAAGLGTQPTGAWPWSDVRRLDTLALANDERRIETLYALNGYYSAEVKHEIEPLGSGRVRVTFTIEEGAPTRVEAIDVRLEGGAGPEVQEVVQAPLPLRAGDVIDYAAYEAARDGLERRLEGLGYALASVEGQVGVDPGRRAARVILEVSPGPIHRYGELRIEGLAAIPVEPIQSIARRALRRGARYSPDAIEDAEARLDELGAFRSVRIRVEAPQGPRGESVVVVQAEELPVHSVVLGGGVGVEQSGQQIRGLADYGNTSFLGGARHLTWRNQLALRFLPSFYDRERTGTSAESALEVTQPEILDRTSLAVRATYEHVFRDAYAADRLAARVGLPYRIGRRTRLTPGVSHERFLGFSARRPRGATSLPLGLECPEPCQLTYVSADLVRDRRADPVSPRRGHLGLAGAQYGFPLPNGGSEYIRLQTEVRGYAPLGRSLSVASRARVGALFPLAGGDSRLPQRFYGGGDGGHRGFGPEQLAPVVEDSGGGFLPIGGEGAWLASVELRWRATQRWELVPFADLGDVTVKPLDLDPRAAHLALGLGVRLFTIAGPVRLDVAYRVSRRARVALDTGAQVETRPLDFLAFFVSLGEAF